MSSFVLTDASILLDGVALTGKSNQLGLTYEAETQDATVFGDGTRRNKAGLFVLSGEVGGFTDEDITGTAIFDAVGGGPSVFQAAAPGDDGTVGYAFRSIEASYTPVEGSVGDMAGDSISLSGRSGSPLVRGTILHPLTAESAGIGNGTARQLGAVASGESVYGALNVTAGSGTLDSLTVKSDDHSGFTTATNRFTFASQTGPGADWKSAAGPITDDWWRVDFNVSSGGPFTFQVLVGIV